MPRPTIPDLARAAGVSVATVNRLLHGSARVRPATAQRVVEAAERIGFWGTGALRSRAQLARPRERYGVLLLQPHRPFYRRLAQLLGEAAAGVSEVQLELAVDHLEELAPEVMAQRLLALGERSEAIAAVAADHPLVRQAVERLHAAGVPVLGLIAPLEANCPVGYVGLDHWKVGRTAGWAFHHLCRRPGGIATLVGSHRFRNQDLNESGFRSYMREHGAGFTLLEAVPTFESATVGREVTEALLARHPELVGLYVSGGGISGALAALRASGRAGRIVTVGYELFDVTRDALADGTLTLVLAHPLDRLARETVAALREAKRTAPGAALPRIVLPFEIWCRENL